MSVIVISKREFHIEKNDKLIPLLKKLRKHAKKQKGFVSRATYTNINNPGENIVISEWKKEEQWQKWMKNEKVLKIQSRIDSLIGERTVFEVYKPENY